MATPAPLSDDDKQECFLSCRYGDLDDVQQYVKLFGPGFISELRDGNGNTVLHMACGNGHTELLDYLLPIVSPALLSAQNNAQSTPLHWAALNSHLSIMQKLVEFPAGPGIDLIDIKNAAGLSPLGEAEQAGWEEGAKWLVQMMKLDANEGKETVDNPVDGDADDDADGETSTFGQNIEVEIEDADGQVAKMTISGGG